MTVDESGTAATRTLTQLVVRDQLTTRAQRLALLAALASVLEDKLGKFDHEKPKTYFAARRYAQHASTLVLHEREWGALPAALARGGTGGRAADRVRACGRVWQGSVTGVGISFKLSAVSIGRLFACTRRS